MSKLLVLLIIFFTTPIHAQYLSYGMNRFGPTLGLGVIVEHIDLSVDYDFPIAKSFTPSLRYLNIGYNYAHNPNHHIKYLTLNPKVGWSSKRRFIYSLESGVQRKSTRLSAYVRYDQKVVGGVRVRYFIRST